MASAIELLSRTITDHEQGILDDWTKELAAAQANSRAAGSISAGEQRSQTAELLALVRRALGDGGARDVKGPAWRGVREMLGGISRSRAAQGFSPSETALFVFSLKRPIVARVRREHAGSPEVLLDATQLLSDLIDDLGLYTTEVYQQGREEIILRQQQDMLELSTPVVKLWDGVLALPMIGTLDSARTQVVMEALLQRIVETGAELAIIDITGVPTVDTLTAQHLIKTVTAARLMGAECIISGVRPQIAQTIVHLGVDLAGIMTKATLADAFALALRKMGLAVVRGPQAK